MFEQMGRALKKEGRTQKWVIIQLKKRGINFSDSMFSMRKYGSTEFSPEELEAIEEILETKFEL